MRGNLAAKPAKTIRSQPRLMTTYEIVFSDTFWPLRSGYFIVGRAGTLLNETIPRSTRFGHLRQALTDRTLTA